MQTPRGYITLTNHYPNIGNPRIAALNVAWYFRNAAGFTVVTLHSRSIEDDQAVNETLHVKETEAEIDALIEAAQASEVTV
jgi:hypothetical protein